MFSSIPNRYPDFQPDQILTAGNLDDLFNYLDEGERLTRTNLIGIGIVCGLEVFTDPGGKFVTVSKGVGITSQGYLVAIPATKYEFCTEYDATKDIVYDRFTDSATKKQRFDLYELARAGSPQAKKALSKEFLGDKVALVFVELLATGNKNCDPDSCDDKGVTVNVDFKILLIEEKNVKALEAGKTDNGHTYHVASCASWPEVKLPRYNVPATTLPDSATILNNYLTILQEPFLQKVEDTLSMAYASMQLLVANDLPTNPFTKLRENLSFLYDGTITLQQLVMVQYFYDHLSDLLQGYEELRGLCGKYLALCCPDANLFARHLLLHATYAAKKAYRHHFVPSPALNGGDSLVGELQMLMRRLAYMVRLLQIPPKSLASLDKKQRTNIIRITPSKLGDVPLSNKAIPYYYDPTDTPPIINHWNYAKAKSGRADTNLSYYGELYNPGDDQVRRPLAYDMEPYNFFRIEGHIGQPWQKAFNEIYQAKYKYRLPFEVVALNGDFRSLVALVRSSIADLGKVLAEHPEQWRKVLCYFSDIEMQYDMQAAELRCTIAKVMFYLYNLPNSGQTAGPSTSKKAVSALLSAFFPGYITNTNTYGEQFDAWYPTVKNLPYINPTVMAQFGSNLNFGRANIAAVTPSINLLALMYYLEKIHEALPAGIIQVNIATLEERLRDAVGVAGFLLQQVKQFAGQNEGRDDPEMYLQLDAVIRICKRPLLLELYRNFVFRFYLYLANQSFAMYSFLNSGIQHKAGVPVGGTFIMVYHDAMPERQALTNVRENTTNVVDRERTVSDLRNTAASATTKPGAGTDPARNTAFSAEATNRTNIANEATIDATRINISEAYKKMDLSQKMMAAKDETSKLQAVKEVGMFYLQSVVDKTAEQDKLTNKELLDLVENIPDGTVIADFYLPYICASECMPMSFVVLGGSNDEEEPEKPTIKLEPAEYCSNMADEFPVTVTPALPAGTFGGEGTSVTNNQPTFKPSAVNLAGALKKEVTLSYASGGSTATQKVTVYAAPKALFKATQAAPGALTIVLTQVEVAGESIQWQLNGTDISTDANPKEFKVEKSGTYKVSVLVKNGPCESTSTAVEVEVAEAPTPTIGIKPKQFCNSSTDTVPVDLGPTPLALDGYKGEGTVVQAGQAMFVPILVQLGTAASKEVTLSYSAFGKKAETKVTVFAMPQGSISAFPSTASALSFQVKNNVNFGSKFSWKVNGQEFSTEREPGIQKVEKPGTFVVTLDIVNGACKNAFTATVVLAQQEVAPVCSTLGQWNDEYSKWKSGLGRLFPPFNRLYPAMPAVDALFTQQIPPLLTQALAQQLNALNSVASPGAILEWMSQLHARLIMQNTDFRAPAIDLYRILDGLLMFYACNQTADIDKAKIPTQPSFEKVVGMVNEWRQVSQSFTPADRTMTVNFSNTVQKEFDNVSATAPGKKIYLDVLVKLGETLKGL